MLQYNEYTVAKLIYELGRFEFSEAKEGQQFEASTYNDISGFQSEEHYHFNVLHNMFESFKNYLNTFFRQNLLNEKTKTYVTQILQTILLELEDKKNKIKTQVDLQGWESVVENYYSQQPPSDSLALQSWKREKESAIFFKKMSDLQLYFNDEARDFLKSLLDVLIIKPQKNNDEPIDSEYSFEDKEKLKVAKKEGSKLLLDIRQTALLFYYLREKKIILDHLPNKLGLLLHYLTGYSETNIRTIKGFGAIHDIKDDVIKAKIKGADIKNYNLTEVRKALQSIVELIDIEINKRL